MCISTRARVAVRQFLAPGCSLKKNNNLSFFMMIPGAQMSGSGYHIVFNISCILNMQLTSLIASPWWWLLNAELWARFVILNWFLRFSKPDPCANQLEITMGRDSCLEKFHSAWVVAWGKLFIGQNTPSTHAHTFQLQSHSWFLNFPSTPRKEEPLRAR